MRTAIFSSNNQELIQNYERWIQIKQEIARLYTLPVEQRTANPEELESNANNLERLLVRNSTEFSDFEKSLRIDWTTIRDGLSDGQAAIEFTQFTNSRDSVVYCALIVKNDFENPLMVPLFEEKSLEKILGSFGGNNLTYINGVYGVNTDSNNNLYNLIWNPIEKHLDGVNTIFFSPSGLLHKVSFAAVSKGINSYLIDDYALQLVSTTANVSSQKVFNLADSSVVSLFGGIAYTTHPDAKDTWTYLKGTLDETNMIKNILQQQISNINISTDSTASENIFKQLSPTSDVLHVATHGFFYPDPLEMQLTIEAATEYGEVEFRGGSPTFGMDNFVRNQNPLMRSGLVFAGVNDFWSGAKSVKDDDGVLTALEVINIDLRQTQLVVMSACETGLGDIAGSEGVYGLQRAFKMAGTNFLIMSLWQVPDKETSEFMQTFYTLLLHNRDLQKSFSQTQAEMRQKYDPFFWAAFVLLE
jgi:CHAT domain-containing protein